MILKLIRWYVRVTAVIGAIVCGVFLVGVFLGLLWPFAAAISLVGSHLLVWLTGPPGSYVAVAVVSSWITALFLRQGKLRMPLLLASISWVGTLTFAFAAIVMFTLLGVWFDDWVRSPSGENVGAVIAMLWFLGFFLWLSGELLRRLLRMPEPF